MSLSHAYGVPPPPDVASDILLRALDLGVTHFDTAALYGFGANEELVGRTLGPHRSRFTLASKCGIYGVKSETGMRRVIDGRPAALKQNCEDSLRRLRTDVIDLYYLHRWDKSVPIEESIGALSDLAREGKFALSDSRKCPRPRCSVRTPCIPSRRCRANTRCVRETPK
jgi:aryl-alcohol dehydrogenase-like predicted oxidoreductase